MKGAELEIFRRLNSVVRDLRSGGGPLRGDGVLIPRDVVAVRLVEELSDWCDGMEPKADCDHSSWIWESGLAGMPTGEMWRRCILCNDVVELIRVGEVVGS